MELMISIGEGRLAMVKKNLKSTISFVLSDMVSSRSAVESTMVPFELSPELLQEEIKVSARAGKK